ncbi:MAG TPA: cob(I)yrinic acid a,c-diamide adenosyltransferase, partial [Bacilli bacterium]
GDAGQTGVIGGRVYKDDVRVEAYGTIDELNCFVGQTMSFMSVKQDPLNKEKELKFADIISNLLQIQHELFDCGSDLAFVDKGSRQYKVSVDKISQLEQWIDAYDAETMAITRFILPGGSLISSSLHVCRTVCRRAERLAVTLSKQAEINNEVLRYLNRLSDLFFTLARTANVREGTADVEYIRSAEVFGQNL